MAQGDGEPWFRRVKDTWYVWHDGRQVSLSVRGEGNRKAAMAAWHRLMANGSTGVVGSADESVRSPAGSANRRTANLRTGGTESRRAAKSANLRTAANGEHRSAFSDSQIRRSRVGVGSAHHPHPVGPTVGELFAAYLERQAVRAKGETVRWLRRMAQPFLTAHGSRPAAGVKPHEFEAVARECRVKPNTVRHRLATVVAAYKWAAETELIEANPVARLRLPRAVSRGAKAVITEAEHEAILKAAKPEFRPFVTGLWLTGCRPGELARLTAADVDFSGGAAVLTEHKTAHATGRPRVIYLTAEAVGLFADQARANPTGPLFRNRYGRYWRADAIGQAMRMACRVAGLPVKHAYGYRHSFATQALVNGVPDATVAALLGHQNTAMLHRHYSHLTARSDVLRAAAARVRG